MHSGGFVYVTGLLPLLSYQWIEEKSVGGSWEEGLQRVKDHFKWQRANSLPRIQPLVYSSYFQWPRLFWPSKPSQLPAPTWYSQRVIWGVCVVCVCVCVSCCTQGTSAFNIILHPGCTRTKAEGIRMGRKTNTLLKKNPSGCMKSSWWWGIRKWLHFGEEKWVRWKRVG